MTDFLLALNLVSPYYNLAFAAVALYLFIKLFQTEAPAKQLFPWKVLFAAFLIYIVEELLTVLRAAQLIVIPVHINGFFEFVIITLFIYTLLKQKEIARL